jgi:hypothetical protein
MDAMGNNRKFTILRVNIGSDVFPNLLKNFPSTRSTFYTRTPIGKV